MDLICPVCTEEEEGDTHFLLQCPVYEDLRSRYLKLDQVRRNDDTFVQLLSSTEEQIVRRVALYIFLALKRRETATQHVMS